MSDYNFKMKSLHFNFENNQFSLEIEVVGDEFPTPDSTVGTLSGSQISFSLESTSGQTTNSATFTYSQNPGQDSYTFVFVDFPVGEETDAMNGSVASSVGGLEDFFTIGDCVVENEAAGDPTFSGRGSKKGSVTVRKKPHVTQMFECVSMGLNSNQTSMVMTFIESETDQLTGDISNVADSLFAGGLTISTSVSDGGNHIDATIGELSMAD